MEPYFTPEEETSYISQKEIAFYHRKHRFPLPGFLKDQSLKYKPNVALQFRTGDVITVTITKE